MTRRFLCILLTLLVLLQCFGIFAAATETPADETIAVISESAATEATQAPTQSTQPPTEATQPPAQNTEPPAESTPPATQGTEPPAATTAPTTPAGCSHTYGGWSTSEGAHSRTCTQCGEVESAGHTWYAETVTVAPTCKDAGGTAKVCTVCELILIVEITPPLTTHTYDNACDTQCNVCSLSREVTHTYSAAWTNSAKGHWHACAICGAADEVKAHYAGPAATEEKEQICLTCGYVLMQRRNHVHQYETTWSSDDFSHWHACTGCSEKKDQADHSYEDSCDADCSLCGHTRSAVHSYSAWQQDETTHSGVCTLCGEENLAEAHIPDAAGTNCAVCGYALEATEPTHVHSFEEDTWELDDAGHWKTCSCGEKQQTAPHDWEKTVEIDDLIKFTCKTCGAQKQEQAERGSFPLLLVLILVIMAASVVGIVICILMLRKQGRYSR